VQSRLTRMGTSRLADLCSWPSSGGRGLTTPAIATRTLGAVTSTAASQNAAALATLLWSLA
jgi:hypothetical protein